MKQNTERMFSYFKNHNGIVRFSSVIKSGFHSDTLKELEKEGKIKKIAKGLYRITNYKPDVYPDLTIASLQAPRGIICLISALSFHEATNEIPGHVDIAIPAGTRANRIDYPPIQFYRFSPKTWNAGIEKHQIGGNEIKVYNLAKTIADCFKFRNKIGANIARNALKTAITEKNVNPKDIMKYAKICRVDKIIKPILETLL